MQNFENKDIKGHLSKIIAAFTVTCFTVIGYFFTESFLLKSKVHSLENLNHVYVSFLDFKSDLIGMETGLRGFVIAGENKFLTPYETSLAKYPVAKEKIYKATSSNYELQKKYRNVLDAHEDWLVFAKETISRIKLLKSENRFDPNTFEHNSQVGQIRFDKVREEAKIFTTETSQLLAKNRVSYNNFKDYSRFLSLILTILVGAIFIMYMKKEINLALKSYAALITQLEAKREEAERASKSKDLFLANMSHEIRTPLGAIIGFSEIMEEQEDLSAEGATHINFIKKNSKYLLSLINDLFDISKVANDKVDIVDEKIDVRLFIRDIKNIFLSKASNKQIDLNFRLSNSIPKYFVNDPTRLKQILANLIANALKFTPQGKSIDIIFSCENNKFIVDVVDQGIGIKPEHKVSIFESFTQGDITHARSYGGAGLGLALSSKLAGYIGAKLELVSSEVGEGSHFRLAVQLKGENALQNLEDEDFLSTESKFDDFDEVTTVEHFNFKDKNILLAEDAKENQVIFKIYLATSKASLNIVSNGAEAVREALGTTPYDIILMDIQMPGMDGYEAIKILRNSGYQGKVIALTAHALKGEKEKCLKAGFDAYLSKPVSQLALLSKVEKHMQRKRSSLN